MITIPDKVADLRTRIARAESHALVAPTEGDRALAKQQAKRLRTELGRELLREVDGASSNPDQ